MAFSIKDGKALGEGGKSVGSFESAYDELSGKEGEEMGVVSKDRVVFSKLIKDEDMCQQVLQDAMSFKVGDEDLHHLLCLRVVKISPTRPHLLLRCSTCTVSISMGGCSLFDQTRALPALAHTVSLGWSGGFVYELNSLSPLMSGNGVDIVLQMRKLVRESVGSGLSWVSSRAAESSLLSTCTCMYVHVCTYM